MPVGMGHLRGNQDSRRGGGSLELFHDVPLLLGHHRHLARCGVLSLVPLLALPRLPNDPARCRHRLDHLGDVLVPLDALDLREQPELILQRLAVGRGLLLAVRQDPELLVALGLPDPDVRVLGAGQDEARVRREVAAEDALHPLPVVDVPRALLPHRPEPHRLVVARRDELLAGGAVRDVQDGHGVVPMPVPSHGEVPHVEGVEAAVLVRHREVDWLHRVPAHGVGPHLQDHLADRGVPAEVVEGHGPVHRRGGDQRRLRGVEAGGDDALAAPLEGVQRRGPLVVPDVHRVAGGDEDRLLPVVVHRVRDRRGVVGGHRRRLQRGRGRLQGPHLRRLVVPGREDARAVGADHHVPDEALVRVRDGPAAHEVPEAPDAKLAVAAAAHEGRGRVPRHGHALHGIGVAIHRLQEGLRENLFDLHRVQGPLILPRPLQRVKARVGVPEHSNDAGLPRIVLLASLQHLDFHRLPLAPTHARDKCPMRALSQS
mmetsp:Transcript_119991/g.340162  ORF Transcript_119991/g.340162 Transcript_119991/m.340162 type:complete len:486 (-) Transcript_119991:1-1458(-)